MAKNEWLATMTQAQAGLMCHAQILGTGSAEATPCCIVVTDRERYLFNVGEGIQRLCMEHKVKATKIDNIFLSHLHAESLGGLPGMLLTLADVGKKSITIHGPVGLKKFFYATRHFMRRESLHVTIKEYSNGIADALSSDQATVHAIVMTPSPSTSSSTSPPLSEAPSSPLSSPSKSASKRRRLSSSPGGGGRGVEQALCYVFRTAAIQGKFMVDKAKALGIPAGPIYGRLKAGHAVTLPDGRTIDPSEVVGPSVPGTVMAIVACPTADYLPSLVQNQHFNHYTTASTTTPDAPKFSLMVHFTPYHVATTEQYRSWMMSFGDDVTHIMASYPSDHHRSPFRCARLNSLRLSLIDDAIFRRPVAYSPGLPSSSSSPAIIPADCLLKYVLSPRVKEGLDASLALPDISLEDESQVRAEAGALGVLELLRQQAHVPPGASEPSSSSSSSMDITHSNHGEGPLPTAPHPIDDIEVTFLGTGSAIPSKFRNVTGIYVKLRGDGRGILLDCGEGTFSQLVTLLPKAQVSKLLLDLRAIWISHPHADHHLGILRILAERAKLVQSIDDLPRLLVVGPKPVLSWLREYRALDGTVDWWGEENLVDIDAMTSSAHAFLRDQLGITSLVNIAVKHCPFAYAVVIDGEDGWRLVYSGDTRPSDRLVQAGKGATVLIHEATFEEGKQHEAVEKKHCTIPEALSIAKRMMAKHVILTHFSQRYPKFPVIPEEDHLGVVVAFDLMKVRLGDLPRVAGLLPVISKLFPPEEEDNEDDEPLESIQAGSEVSGKKGNKKALGTKSPKEKKGKSRNGGSSGGGGDSASGKVPVVEAVDK